jgi:hypothetical protein
MHVVLDTLWNEVRRRGLPRGILEAFDDSGRLRIAADAV